VRAPADAPRGPIEIAACARIAHLSPSPDGRRLTHDPSQEQAMYGLIGMMHSTPGDRDRLIEVLLEGTGAMPGCLSYIVARDPDDETAVWITEAWDSEESQRAPLDLPAVRNAIAEGRPMIAGFGSRTITEPVGGHGLVGD
jgi:quinol monooxygenase YgiN